MWSSSSSGPATVDEVVATPHGKWGKVPCAFVVLNANAVADEQSMIDFCRQYLAGYKTPKCIVFRDFPGTSKGKIQKLTLPQQARSLSE